MLPSDYTGKPAGEVHGTVLSTRSEPEADRPLLSLEWLAPADGRPGSTSLIGQLVRYQPSPKLQVGWDIGLGFPTEGTRLEFDVGQQRVRLGVARMVYFDDRTQDRRLDWSCGGPDCDRVKAISAQYVLYIESPPYCQTEGRPAQPRLRPGYHYYSFDGIHLRQLSSGEAMSFSLTDRTPADADPSAELRAFAGALWRSWSVSALEGC